MNRRAQVFIGVTSAVGIALLVMATLQWHPQAPLRFLIYLAVAILSCGFKVLGLGHDRWVGRPVGLRRGRRGEMIQSTGRCRLTTADI